MGALVNLRSGLLSMLSLEFLYHGSLSNSSNILHFQINAECTLS